MSPVSSVSLYVRSFLSYLLFHLKRLPPFIYHSISLFLFRENYLKELFVLNTRLHNSTLPMLSNQLVIVIYIHFSAFDVNNHSLLLKRFNSAGFLGTTLNWPLFLRFCLIFCPQMFSFFPRLIFFFKQLYLHPVA